MKWLLPYLALYALCALCAHADEISAVETLHLQTADGARSYELAEQSDATGERELFVVDTQTHSPVLVARDLDHSGRFDAWFILDDDGVVHGIDRGSDSEDEKSIAEELIRKYPTTYKHQFYLALMFRHLADTLTLSVSQSDDEIKKLVQEEIDLEEFSIRTERVRAKDPRDPQLGGEYLYLSDAWAAISNEAARFEVELLPLVGLDTVLMLVAKGAAKKAEAGVVWSADKLASSAAGIWVKKIWGDFAAAVAKRAVANPVVDGVTKTAADLGVEKLTGSALKETIGKALVGFRAHDAIQVIGEKSAQAFMAVSKGAMAQWKYIAVSQGLQLVAEVKDRAGEDYSKDHLKWVENTLTDKGFIQDMAYMTWDSTLQTGVSAAMPEALWTRIGICAVISFIDSVGVNVLVR